MNFVDIMQPKGSLVIITCYYKFSFVQNATFKIFRIACSRSAKKICRQISVDADIASLGKNIPNTFHLNSIFKCSNT